ncbi:MAG TPA: carbohydrate porin [Rhodocyclaceae bacterium]|nr:carbohydrate porin [Rhodocyclaceae bacterium]
MHPITITAALSLCCLSLHGYAQGDDTPDFAANTLTGDWGGARPTAAKSGILWEGLLKLDTFRNSGGRADGGAQSLDLELKMKLDFERLAGWQGGSGMIRVLDDSHAGVNARRTGSLTGVSNIEVPVPASRLFEAWLQQSFLDDRAAVLAGLYPIDSEFFTMDSAGLFFGPQYGTPADLGSTRGPSIFNNSAFGLRAKWQASDRSLYTMAAVLDGIPNDPAQPKRTAIRFAKGDGAFEIAEVGWLPAAAEREFQGHAKLAFGLWRYTVKVNDLLDVDADGKPLRRNSVGGYLLGERTVYRLAEDGGRYVSTFGRYTWTDGNSTPIADSVNIGIHVHGPLASRPDDLLGVACTRAGLSGKFRRSQLDAGTAMAASEDSLELTYRVQTMPWLALQPVIQQIRHPGGTSAAATARLIGLRIELAF